MSLCACPGASMKVAPSARTSSYSTSDALRRCVQFGSAHSQTNCGTPETLRQDQISAAPGEWLVYTDVAGQWALWPGVIPARDGASFAERRSTDVYVAPLTPEPSGTHALAGALLFMTSDALLAFDRFIRPFRVADAAVMATYYTAQALIALSTMG